MFKKTIKIKTIPSEELEGSFQFSKEEQCFVESIFFYNLFL